MTWADIADAHGMHRTDLYHPHGTDKGAHGYMEHYQRVLGGHSIRSILEIGVQSGASLVVWSELFPDARIVGIDIDPDCGASDLDGHGFDVLIGDASDPAVVESLLDESFDLIIDDGSHLAEHTAANLDVWAHRLAPGGVYVIEDAVFGSTSWVQSVGETIDMLLAHGLTPFAIERSHVQWVAHQHYGGMMAVVFADSICEVPRPPLATPPGDWVQFTWPGPFPDLDALEPLLVTVTTPRNQASLHRELAALGYVPELLDTDGMRERWQFIHPDGRRP